MNKTIYERIVNEIMKHDCNGRYQYPLIRIDLHGKITLKELMDLSDIGFKYKNIDSGHLSDVVVVSTKKRLDELNEEYKKKKTKDFVHIDLLLVYEERSIKSLRYPLLQFLYD